MGPSPGLSKSQFPHLDSERVPAPGSQVMVGIKQGGAYRGRGVAMMPHAHEELAWWWLPLLLPRVFLEECEMQKPLLSHTSRLQHTPRAK